MLAAHKKRRGGRRVRDWVGGLIRPLEKCGEHNMSPGSIHTTVERRWVFGKRARKHVYNHQAFSLGCPFPFRGLSLDAAFPFVSQIHDGSFPWESLAVGPNPWASKNSCATLYAPVAL